MSNPFVLLTVFFATVSVVLAYALIFYHDTNKQLRHKVNYLWRAHLANESHLAACGELLNEYRLLEQRNGYLEQMFGNFKNIVAGAKLMAPTMIVESEQFTVRQERGESP